MPRELILRQQTILLSSDAVDGEEQDSLDGDFQPLRATYAVCNASQNLQERVNYVRDLNTPSNTQALGPFEVSLDISPLCRSPAERRLSWENIDLPRLKTMVTAHLGTRILRGPARIMGPRQNLWSAKRIDAFTEWIVDSILAAAEASAPWYLPEPLLAAKLPQCSNQDHSIPSPLVSRIPGPSDLNYHQRPSTSARESEILERIHKTAASKVSSGQAFVPNGVLHAISVPITPTLAVLFDQCFDADHYPAPISEVQIRPATSPDVESLDGEHPNAHIRVALLHTIGHILEDIITDPTQNSLPENCVIPRMSLRSPCSLCEQQPGSIVLVETAAETTEYQGMFKQPETNPITEEQLIDEVRGIYAGLVMVEKKCIEVDKQQAESKAELSQAQWQALISVHRTLLYEHHDFFLASQHPSASPMLKRLAEKYAMPARMWRYGIHSFLEVLRQRLPESLDYMLNFIYLAYSMVTLLLESVSAFRDTWIECLGDLARYRMAVEDSVLRDRETWAAVSRKWYNQYADSPDVGRIQHHLAVLARPDVLQQLFYYNKALVCVRPFPNARERISFLLNPCNSQLLHQPSVVTTFLATHGVLFTKGPPEQFITRAKHFLSLFRQDINRFYRAGQHGFYIMSVNFASMLQYGELEAAMAVEFVQKKSKTLAEAHGFALEWTSSATAASLSCDKAVSINGQPTKAASQILSQTAFQGSCLAFHTLSIFLEQMGDSNVYPSAHTSLAFIWCLALHPLAMQQVERLIPWLGLTKFLNTLFQTDTDFHMIENEAFPLPQYGVTQQLSEDFLIRGQVWSRLYYPEKFFEGAPSEDNRSMIEEQTAIILRKHRCLWLGARIATVRLMIA
ncbi:DNA/RNA-binding domain E.t1.c1-type [Penicillium capsulatum]|uniref:DNA/RNA-binding domain E.t1.c1-type n=1 Tax=Penicillium capsulatum TaxID=69766 RepID=A0A9W9HS65_9EURO|nr:DNA/RNA-binding domain E.t1.c1-type [Penicillium capsulatum]KAJ6105863.1 DNA/RNA-binding domain E.t1.c1-type [Penicillium capsulatum]